MKTKFVMTLLAAMPLIAQDLTPPPASAPSPGAVQSPNKRQGAAQKKAMLTASMDRFDADKDGKLNPVEFAALKKHIAKNSRKAKMTKHEMLAKFDLNKDGKLSKEERAARKAAAPKKEKKNKEPLTAEQKTARLAKQLAKVDLNKDGYLDKAELAAAAHKKAKKVRQARPEAKKMKKKQLPPEK